MQTTQQIADRLVALCREDKNLDCIKELYADNATSTESNTVKTGRDTILQKNINWFNSVETLHSTIISEPIVTGNFFALTMDIDATYKQHGRFIMREIGVYEVKDGKIISDRFFYNM
ncbi:MAG: nuclear transport factor 2 family protein [Bacteroidota bacterium]